MPNIIYPVENDQARDFIVAHIADFNFKKGFRSAGVMRRLEWFYCVSGSGHLKLDGKEYDLHAGVMFCSGTPVPRALWCDEDKNLDVIMCGCVGDEVENMFHEAMGVNTVMSPSNADEIYKVAKAMLDVAASYEPLSHLIVTHYLPVLLTTIRQGRILSDRDEFDHFNTYLRCKRFMDESYARIFQVEDVAIEMDISHEYMCRLFKRHNTYTPHAYLMRLKMHGALQRLLHTTTPIKAIASDQGFSSASAFSKAFKRVMGISPAFIREKKSD